MYQNKTDDKVVTPAHLLLLPLDSSNLINYMSFKDIGLNTLNESAAFSKIRNSTKIYNSHLVHTPSTLTSKYNYINSTYVDENALLTTSSFGVKKQHNNISPLALGNSASVSTLDSNSFEKFLSSTLSINERVLNKDSSFKPSPNSLTRPVENSSQLDSLRTSSMLTNASTTDVNSTKLTTYSSTISSLNDNSDKAGLAQPSAKVTSQNATNGVLNNNSIVFRASSLDENSSVTADYNSLNRNNQSTTTKEFNLSGPNSKVLANDQSIRNFSGLTPNKSHLNLSSSTNTLQSNINLTDRVNKPMSPVSIAADFESGNVDYDLFNKLGSNRSFIAASHPSVLSSNNLERNSLSYDRSHTVKTSSTSSK